MMSVLCSNLASPQVLRPAHWVLTRSRSVLRNSVSRLKARRFGNPFAAACISADSRPGLAVMKGNRNISLGGDYTQIVTAAKHPVLIGRAVHRRARRT